jgi:hypothetical protein
MAQALALGGVLALIGGAIYLMLNPTHRNNHLNDDSSGSDHGTGFSAVDNATSSGSASSDSGGGDGGGGGSSE